MAFRALTIHLRPFHLGQRRRGWINLRIRSLAGHLFRAQYLNELHTHTHSWCHTSGWIVLLLIWNAFNISTAQFRPGWNDVRLSYLDLVHFVYEHEHAIWLRFDFAWLLLLPAGANCTKVIILYLVFSSKIWPFFVSIINNLYNWYKISLTWFFAPVTTTIGTLSNTKQEENITMYRK